MSALMPEDPTPPRLSGRSTAQVVAALTDDAERQLAAALLSVMASGSGADVVELLADERVVEFPTSVVLAVAHVAALAAPELRSPDGVARLREIAAVSALRHERVSDLHRRLPIVTPDDLPRMEPP